MANLISIVWIINNHCSPILFATLLFLTLKKWEDKHRMFPREINKTEKQ